MKFQEVGGPKEILRFSSHQVVKSNKSHLVDFKEIFSESSSVVSDSDNYSGIKRGEFLPKIEIEI
jgi:hypothetical protein